ncbi:MAG: RNA polymerase subunit sigma [Proteobacteria bacterium]|nr:RNA polymerase subunit sigma [Pseudomonadota bacterium]
MFTEDTGAPPDLSRLNSSLATAETRRIAAELLPIFYNQLKHIAHRSRVRLRASNTLQTTALVHEAFLRLGASRGFTDETHFLRAAALAMRHALINYAEARLAEKRGGGGIHVTLSEATDLAVKTEEGLLALNGAVERLAIEMPRRAEVVECRFFGGYSEEDTARVLGVSLRTVQRDWLKARAWLYRELAGDIDSGGCESPATAPVPAES